MRDSFPSPQDERHATVYERPYLEAPAPIAFEPPPRHACPDEDTDNEERERVIIIDI